MGTLQRWIEVISRQQWAVKLLSVWLRIMMLWSQWRPKIITGTRWLLSVLLLYGVYRETGIYTLLALSLVFLSAEVLGWCLPKYVEAKITEAVFDDRVKRLTAHIVATRPDTVRNLASIFEDEAEGGVLHERNRR